MPLRRIRRRSRGVEGSNIALQNIFIGSRFDRRFRQISGAGFLVKRDTKRIEKRACQPIKPLMGNNPAERSGSVVKSTACSPANEAMFLSEIRRIFITGRPGGFHEVLEEDHPVRFWKASRCAFTHDFFRIRIAILLSKALSNWVVVASFAAGDSRRNAGIIKQLCLQGLFGLGARIRSGPSWGCADYQEENG